MKRRAIAALLGVMALPAVWAADDYREPYGAVMGTFVAPDSVRDASKGIGGIGIAGFPITPWFSLEPNFWADVLHRESDKGKDSQYGGGLDLSLHQSTGFVQPFFIVGGGAEWDKLAYAAKDHFFTGYVDAGAGLAFRLTQNFAIRGEGRYYLDFNRDSYPGQHYVGDARFNLGLQYSFGTVIPSTMPAKAEVVVPPPAIVPPPPPAACADTDADGVCDYLDQCPNTPPGVQVDAKGCPLDSDGDGVPDYLDKCPGTPHGFKVDASGCIIEQTVIFHNVNFEFNKATLTPESKTILDEVATGLNAQKDIRVEVSGHTDSIGSAAYNLKLSKKRAAAVDEYLASKGVGLDRLKSEGYGKTRPIASNKTDAGRAENRRVEFKILSTAPGATVEPKKPGATSTVVKTPVKKKRKAK